MQKYESGKNRAAASTLLHLAEALNVPFAYFFPPGSATHQMPATPQVPARLLTKLERIANEGGVLLEEMRAALAALRSDDDEEERK
jgi:transcriptional regulator with XRE-family HTH domain